LRVSRQGGTVAKMMRCRACGLVMEESRIGDLCPACGLKRTVFEEYDDKISDRRRKLMELYIHPITLHFPQAFTVAIPLLLVVELAVGETLAVELQATARTLALLLPFTVVGALATGLFDGQLRFKTLKTPYLQRKLILGAILLALSGALLFVVHQFDFDEIGRPTTIGLALACLLVQVLLGKIGGRLLMSKVRG